MTDPELCIIYVVRNVIIYAESFEDIIWKTIITFRNIYRCYRYNFLKIILPE